MIHLHCPNCRLTVHRPDALLDDCTCPLCGGIAAVEVMPAVTPFAAVRRTAAAVPPAIGREPLECRLRRHGKVARVQAIGEVDLITAREVDRRLQQALGSGSRELVLDLREVTFLDSTGVRLILRWDRLAREDGFDFALVDAPGAVRRVLELTGVRDRLGFARDLGSLTA